MPREYSSGVCHSPLRDSEMMIKVTYTYKVWYLPKLISSHRDHHTKYGICRFSLCEKKALFTAQLGRVSYKIHIHEKHVHSTLAKQEKLERIERNPPH